MIIKLTKKCLLSLCIIIASLIILALLPALLGYRKYLQYRITKNRGKRLQHGINILEPIKIGGIQQWISVRGEKKENPILLIIHGGPGMSMMPFSFVFDSLESHFTIVQWDQRGTGKTYRVNKKTLLSTLTVEQMQADTLEVVNYLRQQFQKEKIFVLGASWGSILGLKLAQDHPELLYAYIGLGQVINVMESEKIGYENALKSAYEINNTDAIEALEKFRDKPLNNLTIKEFHIRRKWQDQLTHKILIKKSTWFSIIKYSLSAPEYSLLDYFNLIRGAFLVINSPLITEMLNVALEDKITFSTAIFIFSGRNDSITAQLPVYEHFKKINAPYKEHIWFENSGHNVPFEETDKFVKCLSAVNNLESGVQL